MNFIKRAIQKFKSIFLNKYLAKKEIARLYNQGESELRSMANVIDVVIKNSCSPEEKKWISKIEALRESLVSSSVKVTIKDFGAGSSTDRLTAEEMNEGRQVVKTIGDICKNVSKLYKWDLLLFKLIREFRPTVCLELGTALGFSAAYQAAAGKLNDQGKVITLEGSESLVILARENLASLGLKEVSIVLGRFQDTLNNVLIENTPLDFVFIDGHHDEHATIDYFKQIKPHLSDNAIIVFDDISWSPGMERAWKVIKKDTNIKASVDLTDLGICVYTQKSGKQTKEFKLAL
jgi:predicted O-methyltransferase YrrM